MAEQDELTGGLGVVVRAAIGELTDADVAAFQRACRVWFLTGGDMPLTRCLGLRDTPAAARRAKRDWHILRASKYLGEHPSANAAGDAVFEAWSTFVSRGPWHHGWQFLSLPPAEATPLNHALWWASSLNGGQVLARDSLRKLLAEIRPSFCQRNPGP